MSVNPPVNISYSYFWGTQSPSPLTTEADDQEDAKSVASRSNTFKTSSSSTAASSGTGASAAQSMSSTVAQAINTSSSASAASAAAKTDVVATALVKSGDTSLRESSILITVPRTSFSTYNASNAYTTRPMPLDNLPRVLLTLVRQYLGPAGEMFLDRAIKLLELDLENGDTTVTLSSIEQPINFSELFMDLDSLGSQLCRLALFGCGLSNTEGLNETLVARLFVSLGNAQKNVKQLIDKGHCMFCIEALTSADRIIQKQLDMVYHLRQGIKYPPHLELQFKTDLMGLYNIFLWLQEILPLSISVELKEKIESYCLLNQHPNYRPISEQNAVQFLNENPNATYVIYNANPYGRHEWNVSIRTADGVENVASVKAHYILSPNSARKIKLQLLSIRFFYGSSIYETTPEETTARVIARLEVLPFFQFLPRQLHSEAEYYHVNTTQQQADKILSNEPVGSYLLRGDFSKGPLFISFKDNKVCRHGLITIDENNEVCVTVAGKRLGTLAQVDSIQIGVDPRLRARRIASTIPTLK